MAIETTPMNNATFHGYAFWRANHNPVLWAALDFDFACKPEQTPLVIRSRLDLLKYTTMVIMRKPIPPPAARQTFLVTSKESIPKVDEIAIALVNLCPEMSDRERTETAAEICARLDKFFDNVSLSLRQGPRGSKWLDSIWLFDVQDQAYWSANGGSSLHEGANDTSLTAYAWIFATLLTVGLSVAVGVVISQIALKRMGTGVRPWRDTDSYCHSNR